MLLVAAIVAAEPVTVEPAEMTFDTALGKLQVRPDMYKPVIEILDRGPGLAGSSAQDLGRAFFTTPETLGDYVLVDFIEQKRAMRGRAARGA